MIALRHVRLDYDFEKFFPQNDPELDRYLAFRERFGHDNDFLMLGLRTRPRCSNSDFLVKVDSLAAHLEKLPMVDLGHLAHAAARPAHHARRACSRCPG